jgi:hypothetical protein
MHVTLLTGGPHPDTLEHNSLFHNIISWRSGMCCHRVIVWFSGKFVCILSVFILKKQIEDYRYKSPFFFTSEVPQHLQSLFCPRVGDQITDPYKTGSIVRPLLRFVCKQAMYIWCDTEVQSCNYCCCGKAILHILSVCVTLSYPTCSLHVLYYIVIWAGSTIFFHVIE